MSSTGPSPAFLAAARSIRTVLDGLAQAALVTCFWKDAMLYLLLQGPEPPHRSCRCCKMCPDKHAEANWSAAAHDRERELRFIVRRWESNTLLQTRTHRLKATYSDQLDRILDEHRIHSVWQHEIIQHLRTQHLRGLLFAFRQTEEKWSGAEQGRGLLFVLRDWESNTRIHMLKAASMTKLHNLGVRQMAVGLARQSAAGLRAGIVNWRVNRLKVNPALH